MIFIQQAGIS